MKRWQVWFFGRSGQVLFWIAVGVVAWFLVGPAAGQVRWGWPFQRSGPAVVLARDGASAPPGGWTGVAKATMPAVVNTASAKTVRGPLGVPLERKGPQWA